MKQDYLIQDPVLTADAMETKVNILKRVYYTMAAIPKPKEEKPKNATNTEEVSS